MHEQAVIYSQILMGGEGLRYVSLDRRITLIVILNIEKLRGWAELIVTGSNGGHL
jgi:hypothetical protein